VKVLVVDDEIAIRLLCRVNLESEGFIVREAGTRAEVLPAVHDFEPDVILLDLMLPGVDPHDEWAVARDLRADARAAGLPIVFLSARADLRGQEEGSIPGPVAYLTKPFNPIDLAPTLRRVVESAS
jgi:two-component system, OmpR family, response regulator MtrA